MRPTTHTLCILLAAVAIMATGACKSGPTATAPPPASTEEAAAPAVVRTPIPTEQVVEEPGVGTIPSVEVTEELPEDLRELNQRGYLQDVFFETDAHELKPESREALAANASWLQQHPSIRVLIEGHCDERNTREYNLALGERRANAVRDYLIFLGVGAHRLDVVSYGEERPFAIGSDESAWRLNRRTHFVVTAR